MKKLFVLAALLAANASAQTLPTNSAIVRWTNATTDVNGNPLPATGAGSLTSTRIARSAGATCATTFGTAIEVISVPIDVLMVRFDNLPAGTNCFRARHVANNPAPDDLSDWSPIVSKVSVVPTGKPGKPLTITIE